MSIKTGLCGKLKLDSANDVFKTIIDKYARVNPTTSEPPSPINIFLLTENKLYLMKATNAPSIEEIAKIGSSIFVLIK